MPLRRVGGWIIAVIIHGEGEDYERVLGILDHVYRAVSGEGYVELHLYPSREYMDAELLREAQRLGARVDAVFPVMHEAWSGLPRIHLVPNEVLALGPVGEAFLVHEAFHSILHGSLEYYTVSLPSGSGEEEWLAAYIAATSIKDLEVHMAMRKHGFDRELLAEKSYWLNTLGEKWRCRDEAELSDVLRAATIWIVLDENPPLETSCREMVAPVMNTYKELVSDTTRPWNHLDKAIDHVRNVLAQVRVQHNPIPG